jgi:hypothetical protein
MTRDHHDRKGLLSDLGRNRHEDAWDIIEDLPEAVEDLRDIISRGAGRDNASSEARGEGSPFASMDSTNIGGGFSLTGVLNGCELRLGLSPVEK